MGFSIYGLDVVNDRFVAKWDCDWGNLDKFSLSWQVYNGDRWDQIGSTDITDPSSIYGIDGRYTYTIDTAISDIIESKPNSTTFRFYCKPVSKVWYYDENGNPVYHWGIGDGEPPQVQYNLKLVDLPPIPPPDEYTICEFRTPENKTLLTIGYEGLMNTNDGINSVRASQIEFVVYEYPNDTAYETKTVLIESGVAETTFQLQPGKSYQVKARSKEGNNYSNYNTISQRIYTVPPVPTGLSARVTNTSTSLNLSYTVTWNNSTTATSYEIEIATNRDYFDVSGMTESETVELPTYTKIGVNGGEYYFRVRAINNTGESDWSTIEPLIIGKAPLAPSIWTTDTIYTIGDTINFYWKHLPKDGTREYIGQIEITYDDTPHVYTVSRENQDEEDWRKNNVYIFSTSGIVRSEKLVYRVRTAGVTMEYGEWSEPKEIQVYAIPQAILMINLIEDDHHNISEYPINIRAQSYDSIDEEEEYYIMTQEATAITLTITSNNAYMTQDRLGNIIKVKAGDVVYKKTEIPYGSTNVIFAHTLTYDDVTLNSGTDYTITVDYLFESGMTATASTQIHFYYFPEAVTLTPTVEMLEDPYIAELSGIIVPFGSGSVLEYSYISGSIVTLSPETGKIYYKHSSTGKLTTKGPASTYNAYHTAIIDVTPGENYFYSGTVYNYNDQDSIIILDEDDNIIDTHLRYTSRTSVTNYMFVPPEDAVKAIVTSYDSDPIVKMYAIGTDNMDWILGGISDTGSYLSEDNAITSLEKLSMEDGTRIEVNSNYEFKLVTFSMVDGVYTNPILVHDYSSEPYTFQKSTYAVVSLRPKQTDPEEPIEAEVSNKNKIAFYKLTDNHYEDYAKYDICYYRRERDDSYILVDKHPYAYDYVHTDTLTVITDPHPTLNGSKYRVIVINRYTGQWNATNVESSNYCPFPIIQWDEEWKSWNSNISSAWTGSYIKMLYNLTQDESTIINAAEIQHAGKRYKSYYYGDSYETTLDWKADIPKSDEETLFNLRRLSTYDGDVYIREPSGTGYWAHVEVSFTREAENQIIPVTIKIKRTDGGI